MVPRWKAVGRNGIHQTMKPSPWGGISQGSIKYWKGVGLLHCRVKENSSGSEALAESGLSVLVAGGVNQCSGLPFLEASKHSEPAPFYCEINGLSYSTAGKPESGLVHRKWAPSKHLFSLLSWLTLTYNSSLPFLHPKGQQLLQKKKTFLLKLVSLKLAFCWTVNSCLLLLNDCALHGAFRDYKRVAFHSHPTFRRTGLKRSAL